MLKKCFKSAAFLFLLVFIISCGTNSVYKEKTISEPEIQTLSLIFAGDIMAHNINYEISSYDKIWKDITEYTLNSDLCLGNIEAPLDSTKERSSYPDFNIPKDYIQAAINAGFNVFSLANNHTNDQGLSGIKETQKSMEYLREVNLKNNTPIYFSGLRTQEDSDFSFNLIEKNGFKILFLPVTEILNRPSYIKNINFIHPTESSYKSFLEQCKQLRKQNPCDIFIISIHANEAEYIRTIPKSKRKFYHSLLETADVVWANHAHLIKDREIIINNETGKTKLIMYANGNTISGQRSAPAFDSEYPNGERDNTGDGILYKLTFSKEKNCISEYNEEGQLSVPLKVIESKPVFITTYINTAYEFVLKPLNSEFVDYLNRVERQNWANYINKRIEINNKETKDIVTWQ